MRDTKFCIRRIFLGCIGCTFFYVNEKNEPMCDLFKNKVEVDEDTLTKILEVRSI